MTVTFTREDMKNGNYANIIANKLRRKGYQYSLGWLHKLYTERDNLVVSQYRHSRIPALDRSYELQLHHKKYNSISDIDIVLSSKGYECRTSGVLCSHSSLTADQLVKTLDGYGLDIYLVVATALYQLLFIKTRITGPLF